MRENLILVDDVQHPTVASHKDSKELVKSTANDIQNHVNDVNGIIECSKNIFTNSCEKNSASKILTCEVCELQFNSTEDLNNHITEIYLDLNKDLNQCDPNCNKRINCNKTDPHMNLIYQCNIKHENNISDNNEYKYMDLEDPDEYYNNIIEPMILEILARHD